jgi:preprotein translocase subunit SecE
MAIEKQDNTADEPRREGLAKPSDGRIARWTEFFGEVRGEMRRVTWPTRREVYATTIVVILTASFFGLYLFGVDIVLSNVVQAIFNRFGVA